MGPGWTWDRAFRSSRRSSGSRSVDSSPGTSKKCPMKVQVRRDLCSRSEKGNKLGNTLLTRVGAVRMTRCPTPSAWQGRLPAKVACLEPVPLDPPAVGVLEPEGSGDAPSFPFAGPGLQRNGRRSPWSQAIFFELRSQLRFQLRVHRHRDAMKPLLLLATLVRSESVS
jgi:hypothetical protein